jgi:hypothetical protein
MKSKVQPITSRKSGNAGMFVEIYGGICLLSILAVLVAACSAPIGKPSPTQQAMQALDGLLQAQTLSHSGTLDKLGTRYSLDITANQSGDMHGSLTLGKRSVEVLRAATTVFQRGKSYWTGVVDPETAKVYDDKWIREDASEDLSPAFVVAGAEVEHELRVHFKPSAASDTNVVGSPATKLAGHEGDLYVTQSQPARALRFIGASGFTTTSGLGHLRLDFKSPPSLNLQPPQQFIDPLDHATWPAEFQVEKTDQGACGSSSCELNAVLSNQGGASVGQAVATFTLTDDSAHNLGTCRANIPAIAHLQTETVSCTVSGAEWASFADRGGHYTSSVTVHNPVYDD